VILWRLAPWRASARVDERGGALWFPRELQGAGRHDNPGSYGCLYTSESSLSAVAEALAPFRGSGQLTPSMLLRGGQPLALVQLALDEAVGDAIVDLDDPPTLSRRRLRPSEVATCERHVTQAYAARIFGRQPRALGLRWWSTLEASLMNVTLYDRARVHLEAGGVEVLTVVHPAVVQAAALLGLLAGAR
jgi:hypothetical protein